MRTKTPAQHEAEYTWLKPRDVAEMIGVDAVDTVRELIREGHLEAIDVSRSRRPSYRISPAAVSEYLGAESARVEVGHVRRMEMARGAVYVVEAVGVDRVKVGFSTDMKKRMASLRTASPVPLHLLHAWEADPSIERRLHEALAEYRTHGEWFRAPAAEVALDLMGEWDT